MWIVKSDEDMYNMDSFDRIYYDGSYTLGSTSGRAPVVLARGNEVPCGAVHRPAVAWIYNTTRKRLYSLAGVVSIGFDDTESLTYVEYENRDSYNVASRDIIPEILMAMKNGTTIMEVEDYVD